MMRRKLLFVLLAGGLHAQCAAAEPAATPVGQFIQANCLECHDKEGKSGGLALDELSSIGFERNVEAWEKVIHKLAARQMPPKGERRPSEREYEAVLAELESSLDADYVKQPNPGRTE